MEPSFGITEWERCRKTRFYHQGQSHWNLPVVNKSHLKACRVQGHTQPEIQLTRMHAHNPIVPAGELFITVCSLFSPLWDQLNMWIRLQRRKWKAINCSAVEVRDTYPLLLCGYKSLEAGGHAEAQLVNEWGLRLAVDLHPHTCLKGCILWKGRKMERPS